MSRLSIKEGVERELKRVGVEDTDACLKWAFGKDYADNPIKGWLDMWVLRRSDLFIVHTPRELIDALQKIGKAYLKLKDEKEEEAIA